jgi:hypothetical protein
VTALPSSPFFERSDKDQNGCSTAILERDVSLHTRGGVTPMVNHRIPGLFATVVHLPFDRSVFAFIFLGKTPTRPLASFDPMKKLIAFLRAGWQPFLSYQ